MHKQVVTALELGCGKMPYAEEPHIKAPTWIDATLSAPMAPILPE